MALASFKVLFSQKFASVNLFKNIAFRLKTTQGGRSAGARKPLWSAIKKQLFSNILHTVIIPTPTRPALIAVCVFVCVWGGGGQSLTQGDRELFALDQKMESCSGRCGSTLIF